MGRRRVPLFSCEHSSAQGVLWTFGDSRLEELDSGLVTPPEFDSALIVRAALGLS